MEGCRMSLSSSIKKLQKKRAELEETLKEWKPYGNPYASGKPGEGGGSGKGGGGKGGDSAAKIKQEAKKFGFEQGKKYDLAVTPRHLQTGQPGKSFTKKGMIYRGSPALVHRFSGP